MKRSGRLFQPGPPPSPTEKLKTAFRETALRLALLGSAWRARMLRLWRWVADKYTDDPRHPRTGKRKAKGNSAAHRPSGQF
jgi:transglutaminase-like putative cysteine protease